MNGRIQLFCSKLIAAPTATPVKPETAQTDDSTTDSGEADQKCIHCICNNAPPQTEHIHNNPPYFLTRSPESRGVYCDCRTAAGRFAAGCPKTEGIYCVNILWLIIKSGKSVSQNRHFKKSWESIQLSNISGNHIDHRQQRPTISRIRYFPARLPENSEGATVWKSLRGNTSKGTGGRREGGRHLITLIESFWWRWWRW